MNKMSVATIKLESDEVGPMGQDIAYERGHYTFYDKDNKTLDRGK